MAEDDTKTAEEWTEVDISSNSDAAEKVDFEVDDDNEEVKASSTVEETEEDSETTSTDEIPELDGIETKGAEKRIRQLVKQRKEREEALVEANQEVVQLRTKLTQATQNQFNSDSAILGVKEGELNQKLENARSRFKEAYNSGDHEKLLEAQEELSGAQTEIKLLEQRKSWVDSRAQQYKQEIEQNPPQAEGNYDPLAQDWAARNPWFGQDRIATAAALALDSELKDGGYDPTSPEFYKEIDKRIKRELPGRFKLGNSEEEEEDTVTEEAKPSKPRQVVAGQSRSSVSKNKVRLTKEDVALAKKWQIPLETYAAEKAKAEKADGEYTAIL